MCVALWGGRARPERESFSYTLPREIMTRVARERHAPFPLQKTEKEMVHAVCLQCTHKPGATAKMVVVVTDVLTVFSVGAVHDTQFSSGLAKRC